MTLTPEERVTAGALLSGGTTPADPPTIAPEELLESERGSLITGLVIARAWRDRRYLARLLADPGEVLAAAGLRIPPGVRIRVFQDTPEVRHVALTSLTSEPAELEPLLRELLPLPEGSEVRLIQNTEQALCLVVPLPPAGPELLTDVEQLRRLAPRASVFASGDVVQSMSEAFTASEATLVGAAEVSASSSASAFTSGDVVQSASEAFAASEAALAASAQATAAESASTAADTSVSAQTVQITNTFHVAEAQVDVAVEAEVAVTAIEAQTVATTTTAAAEAEAVIVIVLT
jgi:hypothetical protein